MYAIIRYNQKRIIQNIENFKFHNLQIGVNWCAEWQTNRKFIVANTQPAKN